MKLDCKFDECVIGLIQLLSGHDFVTCSFLFVPSSQLTGVEISILWQGELISAEMRKCYSV